jgi:hypothetical protein
MTLYVGEVLGGPELSSTPFVQGLRAVKKVVAQTRDEFVPQDSGSIDLVFDVSGSVLQFRYEGIRTGRFSKKKRMLQVQVAVPESKVSDVRPIPFVLESAREAIPLAAPVFEKAGIRFPMERYLQLIEKVATDLSDWQADPSYRPKDAHLNDLVEELLKSSVKEE